MMHENATYFDILAKILRIAAFPWMIYTHVVDINILLSHPHDNTLETEISFVILSVTNLVLSCKMSHFNSNSSLYSKEISTIN